MTIQPHDTAETNAIHEEPRWIASVDTYDGIKVTLYEKCQLLDFYRANLGEYLACGDDWRTAIREAFTKCPPQQQLPLFGSHRTRLVTKDDPGTDFIEAFRTYAYALADTYSLG